MAKQKMAVALNEQYQPRFAGDDLPSTRLPVPSRLPTNGHPGGYLRHRPASERDKDPFALRRAALGVLRIIVEKNLNLDLQTLTEEAFVCTATS
jgi:glycyl-tRNA synthetase beta chain